MPDADLRRRLLEDAVDDNLRTAEQRAAARVTDARDRPPTTTRPGRRRRPIPLGPIIALVIAIGALAIWLGNRKASPDASAITDAASIPDSRSQPDQPTATPPSFSTEVRVPARVLPLAVRHVVLDPGHGGNDRGTATDDQGLDLAEKDITLDIATRLEPMLREAGFEVTLTRRSDRTLTLRERAELANRLSADLFVSIHVNWFGARSVRGVETYYLGPTDDPDLNAFAQRENRDSGYALADMRRLLEGIYADVRQDESRALATQVQRALHQSLLPTTPELQDRGVKTAPFVVLVATEMPAILAEVSCLSNRDEVERLGRPRYREHLATALLLGIQAYAHEVHQTEEQGS